MAGTDDTSGSTAAGGAGAGLGLLGIGSLVTGGIDLVKSIFGAVQTAQGTKQLNSLISNRPKFNISQGYQDAFKSYQNMANSNLPGYDIMKGQIDQSGAQAQSNLERGAMSSNQLMSGALSSQDKELKAIQNLGLMSAQWKSQQQQNLIQGQQMMGQQQDKAWDYNVNQPWEIKANMAANKAGVGQQNLFAGLQDMGSTLNNYAGTSAYLKVLQGMQKQGVGSQLPQNNLNNVGNIPDDSGLYQNPVT
jgi:hypothetical protein